MKEFSFVMALRDFFGLQPGQTLQGFLTEVKALTDQDRADFKVMLEGQGYTIKS